MSFRKEGVRQGRMGGERIREEVGRKRRIDGRRRSD